MNIWVFIHDYCTIMNNNVAMALYENGRRYWYWDGWMALTGEVQVTLTVWWTLVTAKFHICFAIFFLGEPVLLSLNTSPREVHCHYHSPSRWRGGSHHPVK